MRIHVLSAGLAAFLPSVAKADGDATYNMGIIQFQYDDAKWTSQNNTFSNSLLLSWNKDPSINVTGATLYKYTQAGNSSDIIDNSADKPAPPTRGPPDDGEEEDSKALQIRSTSAVTTIPSLNDNNTGSVNVTADPVGGDGTDLNEPLFLQVAWARSDGTAAGLSYSRYFAIDDGGTGTNSGTTEFLRNQTTTAALVECSNTSACPKPTSSDASSAQTSDPSTSPGASASSSAAASASSTGSSGLPKPAIIGIAVACGVVGLAIIGAAVWFLCFRRRRRNGDHSALAQQQQQNGSYNMSDGGLPKAGMMMTRSDKDLPHATDSPQSAYAPSRGLRDSMGSGAVGVGAGAGAGLMGHGSASAHHHQHASADMDSSDDAYAPYRDHTPPPAVYAHAHHDGAASAASQTSLPASLQGAGAAGARSPTPPISSRYAHLVEEGMTDEEIRRLEEEERALDVAIEDAGRSSRAQSRTQSRVF